MTDIQVKYLLELADCRNFTEVSRRLYVSQTSVSEQISKLEDELGAKLFVRTKRSVEITPEGEIVTEMFRRMRSMLSECREQIQALSPERRKALHVGCLAGLVPSSLLGRAIELCRREAPEFQVMLEYNSHRELNSNLAIGRYDMIITFASSVSSVDGAEQMLLMTNERALVFAASHPLASKPELDPELLCGVDFFVQAKRDATGFNDYLRFLSSRFGVTGSRIKFVPNVDSMISNVAAGLGVALMTSSPEIVANESLAFRVIPEYPQRTVAVWIRERAHPYLPQFTRTLREALISTAENH